MVQSKIEHECATDSDGDVVYIATTWGATEVIRPVAVAAGRPSPRRPDQTTTADIVVSKHTINCGRRSNPPLLSSSIAVISYKQASVLNVALRSHK